MVPTTVLLAFGPRLFYESLVSELESREDVVPLLSEASELPELLVEVRQTRADAVIVTAMTKADVAGVRSHLFSEFPHLSLIVLSAEDETASVLKQEVVVKKIRSVSVETILTALREGDRYWSPL
jgi:DNA-binding NarL/FixJ family response regulator